MTRSTSPKTPTAKTLKKTNRSSKRRSGPATRQQLLQDLATLRIPLTEELLDLTFRQAEQERLSHLEFLQQLLSQPARQRQERSIEKRIRDARFREQKTLEEFDWNFNAAVIDRAQIEGLASGDFIRRGDNLMMVSPSGVGKSYLLQALGRCWCVGGFRVRYATSAELLADLAASLADQSLPQRLRYWTRFDILLIDEFGFDKIERLENPQAASLLYRAVDARWGNKATALATNIEFTAWSDYLDDPPLATAILDRLVDRAIILDWSEGESYRAGRAKRSPSPRRDGKSSGGR